ncbi:MAG: hypothetical protein EA425_03945 [Puniceicoccaceae bacterium]|nr:MAG: hypothetical protein EA425_03945 [Puniceicoccaceae bacterium]
MNRFRFDLRPATVGLALLLAGPASLPAETSPMEILIHLDRTRQTIEGFGGALITFGGERAEHRDPEFYDRAVHELGVSMIRLPMPDFMEPFNDDDDPDHFNWDGFKIRAIDGETGLDYRMMILQEFKQRGVTRFMASPWSAPAFTKTNRATRNAGYLRMDKTEEFAEFMAAFIILAKRNWDINIGAVTLQNELLFNHSFGSGMYTAYQLREAVRAVMRKFDREGINTLLLLPEDMTQVDRLIEYMQPVMDDPETRHYRGHLASHRQDRFDGVRRWREHTADWGRQNWMTETSGHPQTWPGAIQMARDMHEYLVGGDFSAWVYWQLTDQESAGQYAIMVDYQPTPKFYAAKHFYRYIRPGAVRVETTPEMGAVLPSAYRHHVDGTLTLVLINPTEEEQTLRLAFEGGVVPLVLEGFLSTPKQGGAGEGFLPIDPMTPDDTITLPPMSILTLLGRDDDLRTRDAIDPWPEAVDLSGREGWPERLGDWSERDNGPGWAIGVAASRNQFEWMEREIEAGHLDAVRYDGQNALTRAFMAGAGASAARLIEAGIDVNRPSLDGWTPLHMAAATMGAGADRRAVGEGYSRTDLLRMVLEAGGDVQARTDDGLTPLHALAASAWRDDGYPERIKLLVEAGAEVDARCAHGRTPLHYASWQGMMGWIRDIRSDVVEALLAHGAAVDARDGQGRTPLHYAALMSHERIAAVLLRAGADPRGADAQGETPVSLAATRNEPEVLALLRGLKPIEDALQQIRSGEDRLSDGVLGLELLQAAWRGRLDEVERLLGEGADVFYRDGDGFSALERARDGGHWRIVDLIRAEQNRRQGE